MQTVLGNTHTMLGHKVECHNKSLSLMEGLLKTDTGNATTQLLAEETFQIHRVEKLY